MVSCFCCGQRSVIVAGRGMCRKHFTMHFEEKVRRTISRFGLLGRRDRVAVAASGGKDSTSLLFVLRKLGFDVDALAIDEGIHGYRDATLIGLRAFCAQHSISLRIVSYKDYFGFTLDELLKREKLHPCMACGVLRRYLLNRAARDYDKLATGHNLDDEAQSIMMNMMKANTHLLARLGPKSGVASDSLFTPRVKPLYLCSEREVAAYSFIQGFPVKFTECPNASQSFRASIRDMLNGIEAKHKGTKSAIVQSFMKMMPALKALPADSPVLHCSQCGEPSSNEVCSACSIAMRALQVSQ